MLGFFIRYSLYFDTFYNQQNIYKNLSAPFLFNFYHMNKAVKYVWLTSILNAL